MVYHSDCSGEWRVTAEARARTHFRHHKTRTAPTNANVRSIELLTSIFGGGEVVDARARRSRLFGTFKYGVKA